MANQFDNLHSAEAESAVLGSLLLDNAIYDDVAGILKPADFYLSAHQMLYRQISDLLEDGKPVDILTLEQHLHQQGLLSQAGGLAYIAQLAQNTPSTANANTYAEIVALHSKHRQLQLLGQYIVRETHSTKTADKLEELVEDIDKRFTDFTLRHQNESLDWKQAMKKVLARMTESTANKDPVTGTPTGISELDELTTGGQPGDFIVIGARPSMGKTAFSQTIAYHTLARFPKQSIQYYSMEMPTDQIMQRFLAMVARVSLQLIRKADYLTDEDWARISEAMTYMIDNWTNRLIIDDEAGLTPQKLRTKVRYNCRKYGKPAAIIIDYLQLMQTSRRYENRNLEIAAISQSLKQLAKETGCPVYALSQLNRSLENRANKHPMNADLRESGSLEQDADLILFIYRDEVYNVDSDFPGIAEIIIGKQRNGPLATVPTRFKGEYCLFENLSPAA